MAKSGMLTSLPAQSAVQKEVLSYYIPSDSAHPTHHHHLALQVAHNLRYQHNWTNLQIHTESENSTEALPRPLVSGIPPLRLYTHPDEQIELLQQQKDAGKKGLPELKSEREWVLPSHLREKWSLARFGQVFDAVDVLPTADGGTFVLDSQEPVEEERENRWRTTKRVLLATLDDDSTVVYYIVHDGIVKPRQN